MTKAHRSEGDEQEGGESSSPEALRPEHRVRRRPEYSRAYRHGRRFHGRLATLHVVPNEGAHPRLGITASRKVGNAVVRQRLKRRIREVFRRWPRRQGLGQLDIVVHLRPAARVAGFTELQEELDGLLRRILRESRGQGRPRRKATRSASDSRGRGEAAAKT